MVIGTVTYLDEPIHFVVIETWDCGILVDANVGIISELSIRSSSGQLEAGAVRAHHRLHIKVAKEESVVVFLFFILWVKAEF